MLIKDLNFRETDTNCSAFSMLFSSKTYFFLPIVNCQRKSFSATRPSISSEGQNPHGLSLYIPTIQRLHSVRNRFGVIAFPNIMV